MLTFEEQNHLYKWNGSPVPGVTQIINDAGLVDRSFVDENYLAWKGDLGKKVHLATELYDKDDLNLETLSPVLKSYLDGWKKFRSDYGLVPIEIETQKFHPLYKYAGRLDRVMVPPIVGMSNPAILVDIKSGVKMKHHAIQLAGYELLYNYGKPRFEQIKRRLCVYLNPDGYRVEEYKNVNDANVFLAALTMHNFKNS